MPQTLRTKCGSFRRKIRAVRQTSSTLSWKSWGQIWFSHVLHRWTSDSSSIWPGKLASIQLCLKNFWYLQMVSYEVWKWDEIRTFENLHHAWLSKQKDCIFMHFRCQSSIDETAGGNGSGQQNILSLWEASSSKKALRCFTHVNIAVSYVQEILMQKASSNWAGPHVKITFQRLKTMPAALPARVCTVIVGLRQDHTPMARRWCLAEPWLNLLPL